MDIKGIRRKRFVFVLMTVLTALIQNTVLPRAGLSAAVWLLIPLTVSQAMTESEVPSMLFGLLAGLLWDLASPLPDGSLALFFTLSCCACSLLSRCLFRKTLLTCAVLSAAVCVLCFWFLLLFGSLVKDASAIPMIVLRSFLPSFVLTMITVPVFYFTVRAADRKFRNKAGAVL